MKKYFAITLLAVASLSVGAQTTSAQEVRSLDISKMTTDQKARMLQMAAQMERNDAAGISEKTREEIGKWGELGVGMGRATVAAAKEVGVAANDFVQTPLGKITMAVVVYKIIGKEMIKLILGITTLVFLLTAAVFILFQKKGEVKYEYVPRLWGAWSQKRVTFYKVDNETMWGHFIASGLCCVLAFLLGLGIMFS